MTNKYKHFDWSAVGFTFGNWEEELVWALDIPTQEIDIEQLAWHLDIPYWENDQGERWSVTPMDVIQGVAHSTNERKRIDDADTTYPLDLFEHEGKLFVLDGLHRLAKLYSGGEETVAVRIVPKDRFHEVASEHPFELPHQETSESYVFADVELRKSGIGQFNDGLGIFALRDFRKDELVIEYNLKRLTKEEFDQLPKEERHFTHERHGVIYYYPNPERHVNRHTDPNVYPDFERNGDVALRDIKKGEELSIPADFKEDF